MKRKYNLFRWYEVTLNSPGDPGYQPHCPWVSKRREEGYVKSDLLAYVDDIITRGLTEEDCWEAYRMWVSLYNHMGIKDA